MLPQESLRKADVVTSTGLILLGAAVLWGASGMPLSGTYGGDELKWYRSPATFPLLIGGLIIVFALAILLRAVRDGALVNFVGYYRDRFKELPQSRAAWRILTIMALLVAYVAALRLHPLAGISRVLVRIPFLNGPLTRFCLEPEGSNYVLSSFAFLSASILTFYRPPDGRRLWIHGAFVIGLSAVVSFLVGYIFREQLLVPLP